MKLFAFVRRARRPSSSATAPAAEPASTAVAAMVEDAAAAAVAPGEKQRRRPSSGTASWKPTLGAISEDAAVISTAAAAAAAKAKAKGKSPAAAKAKARPPRRVARSSEYDDFRHFGAPTVLPAFAPTAFLF